MSYGSTSPVSERLVGMRSSKRSPSCPQACEPGRRDRADMTDASNRVNFILSTRGGEEVLQTLLYSLPPAVNGARVGFTWSEKDKQVRPSGLANSSAPSGIDLKIRAQRVRETQLART